MRKARATSKECKDLEKKLECRRAIAVEALRVLVSRRPMTSQKFILGPSRVVTWGEARKHGFTNFNDFFNVFCETHLSTKKYCFLFFDYFVIFYEQLCDFSWTQQIIQKVQNFL